MSDTRYQCDFCGQRFVREDRFLKHKCKQMERDEQFHSQDGQTAWSYYQSWMKAYRRVVPSPKSFLHSKFFNAFYRFALFVKRAQIPDTDIFIRLMREKDISPVLWDNDQVYALYLEHIDRRMGPIRHAEISINTLFDLADDSNVDVSEVFETITPNQLIQLIRQRKISPWILLNSSKFKEFFVSKTTSEEKIILESIIRPPYWKEKFQTKTKELTAIRKYITELRL